MIVLQSLLDWNMTGIALSNFFFQFFHVLILSTDLKVI